MVKARTCHLNINDCSFFFLFFFFAGVFGLVLFVFCFLFYFFCFLNSLGRSIQCSSYLKKKTYKDLLKGI